MKKRFVEYKELPKPQKLKDGRKYNSVLVWELDEPCEGATELNTLLGSSWILEEPVVLPKPPGLWDLTNSVESKKPYYENNEDLKEWNSYVIMQKYSNSPRPNDVFVANLINRPNQLTPRMEYDYYYHTLRKDKHFYKWSKRENDHELMGYVMEEYNIGPNKARVAMKVLSESQIQEIADKYSEK